jgi:hypothetical protein
VIHGKRRSNLLKTFSKLEGKKTVSKGWFLAERKIEKDFVIIFTFL